MGVIWKSIRLALKSLHLDERNWESVLQTVLHSQRSLLCTSTNCTPHERFFAFQRRNSNGDSLPSWLMKPGPVLLRRFVRSHKNEPLVDQVELLDCNPTYASIKYPDGRESTVSVRDLAPCPEEAAHSSESNTETLKTVPSDKTTEPEIDLSSSETNSNNSNPENPEPVEANQKEEPIRRSGRTIKAPQRYGFD